MSNEPKFPGGGDWADFRARMILIEMFGEFDGNRGVGGDKEGREFVRSTGFREVAPLVRTIAGHLRAMALAGPCLPACNHPAPMRMRVTSLLWCRVCGAWAYGFSDVGRGTDEIPVLEAELAWNLPLGRVIPPPETP